MTSATPSDTKSNSAMTQTYEFGDRIRHRKKPEWGVGTVIRVEKVAANGSAAQRLSIRFANAGLKNLMPAHADLERVEAIDEAVAGGDAPSVDDLDRLNRNGWLGEEGKRKVRKLMVSLPDNVRDPFDGPETRLRRAFSLYRFDRTGRSLLDWAVAQSGLDDPLSRFTRHELEELFDRWVMERDNHLGTLLNECRGDKNAIKAALADAPPAAVAIVRRIDKSR